MICDRILRLSSFRHTWLLIYEDKERKRRGWGSRIFGGSQGARRKKSGGAPPSVAAFFVRGVAYPFTAARNLLGGSLFLTPRMWLPPTHFSLFIKGYAPPARKKSSSARLAPQACGIFSAPPLDK